MSTRAQLSETINRLLPGEKNKRIRESILAAATYSGSRTDQLRQSIDAANRVKTGLLVAGTTVIVTDTTSDISGYVWVIDFAIKQPAALETIVILAPDGTYAREDWFVGLADGTIEYRSGTIDALGNSTPPVYDSATEVVLHRVTRNPDSTNTDIDIPPASNLIDFIEQNIIPLVRDGKLTNSGIKAILDDLGAVIGYQFPTTVKGLPGTEDDEFVTKSQLPVISQYGLLNGGTILWTTVGFNFQWSPAVVAIGGECLAPSAEIPLTAAHATLNRVDLLGWLKTAPGVAVPYVIQGTPAPTFNPPPFDPTTFVVGIPINIPYAATTPSGITTEVIYAENAGAPEWVPSSTGTGTSNPADTALPKSGTFAVKDSAVENGFKQIFTRATVIDITTVETFGLDAALIASLGAGQGWTVGFLDASGNPASNTITLPLIKSQLTYQFLAMNLDLFTFTTNSVKGVVLTYVKTKGPAVHAGIFLDNIKLQGGVDQPETPGAGNNGWSPVFSVVTDVERRVLQVSDWVGGTGTKPAIGLYVGATGLEALIANGIDIRGSIGLPGDDGREIELQVNGSDMLQSRYVGDASWTDLFDLTTLGGGGGGGHVIKTVGTPLTQRAGLNFSDQFIVTDDAIGDESKVEIDENIMATRDYVNGGATTANAASRLYLFNNY